VNEADPRERLAAVLVADVVGYSRLMRNDERLTVTTLDEYRSIFQQEIAAHGGRVVDMAGDSILAIFESASGAVVAAIGAQSEIATRNHSRPEDRRMFFRVGVNLGDILEKPDGSIYGDGVNVAARIESSAEPGGVNVSGSVYNSIGSKVDRQFTYLGEHVLKNIEHPVSIYQLGAGDNAPVIETPPAVKTSDIPTLSVSPIKPIGGGDDALFIAEGIHQDLLGSLTKQSAISVVSDEAGNARANFRLEGSVRSAGARLRLSFTLIELASGRQIWSERYDRQLDDAFDLEDEISQKVASAVRIRIKAQAFEILRQADNARLSVGELLSKAAGYFVSSYGGNDEAEMTLKAAIERAPDNSMAHAMNVLCRYRKYEFDPFDIPPDVKTAMFDEAHYAVTLQPSSYFAHLITALIHQDLRGDFVAAGVHAESALDANPGFSPAVAMAAIAKIHTGDPEAGVRELRATINEAPEEPHRFRHQRELAVGGFIIGHYDDALSTIEKLMHQAPDLLRNHLPYAAILLSAGREQEARQRTATLLQSHSGLSLGSMRPIYFGDPAKAAEFDRYLKMLEVAD